MLYFALSVMFICYKQPVKAGMTAKMAAILDINFYRVLQKIVAENNITLEI